MLLSTYMYHMSGWRVFTCVEALVAKHPNLRQLILRHVSQSVCTFICVSHLGMQLTSACMHMCKWGNPYPMTLHMHVAVDVHFTYAKHAPHYRASVHAIWLANTMASKESDLKDKVTCHLAMHCHILRDTVLFASSFGHACLQRIQLVHTLQRFHTSSQACTMIPSVCCLSIIIEECITS